MTQEQSSEAGWWPCCGRCYRCQPQGNLSNLDWALHLLTYQWFSLALLYSLNSPPKSLFLIPIQLLLLPAWSPSVFEETKDLLTLPWSAERPETAKLCSFISEPRISITARNPLKSKGKSNSNCYGSTQNLRGFFGFEIYILLICIIGHTAKAKLMISENWCQCKEQPNTWVSSSRYLWNKLENVLCILDWEDAPTLLSQSRGAGWAPGIPHSSCFHVMSVPGGIQQPRAHQPGGILKAHAPCHTLGIAIITFSYPWGRGWGCWSCGTPRSWLHWSRSPHMEDLLSSGLSTLALGTCPTNPKQIIQQVWVRGGSCGLRGKALAHRAAIQAQQVHVFRGRRCWRLLLLFAVFWCPVRLVTAGVTVLTGKGQEFVIWLLAFLVHQRCSILGGGVRAAFVRFLI